MSFGRVWFGVVWCGLVWCGMVWCGVVWCGVVWCGVVWCGVVWCGVVWCGMVWCGVDWMMWWCCQCCGGDVNGGNNSNIMRSIYSNKIERTIKRLQYRADNPRKNIEQSSLSIQALKKLQKNYLILEKCSLITNKLKL